MHTRASSAAGFTLGTTLSGEREKTMGKQIEASAVVVGGLMLENMALRGGTLRLPESIIPDFYEAALHEFQDLHLANKNQAFEPPDGFRQRCIDYVTIYLESKGALI
jgi:hypothetical protein